MAAYDFGELETLWRRAGGPAKQAPVMAAVALAESGGNPRASHRNKNGSTDRGLWQINSVHGYPAGSSFQPLQNARQAVAVYHSQGFRAWSSYTNGTYRSHLAAGVSPSGGGFGVLTSGNFAGVDQGVDYTGAGLVPALDKVTVTSVRRVSIIEGGSYPLVGFRFDAGPYRGRYGYLMENFQPLVKKGQVVKKGQPLGRAKGSYPYIEYGFASGPSGSPLAPLGSDPHAPTASGQAFLSYVESRAGTQVQPSSGKPSGPVVLTRGNTGTTGPGDPNAGVVGAIGGAAHQVAAPFEGISSFLGKLTSATFWLRALELVGGVVLVLLGLYLLARQVGLAPEPEQVAGALPVGRAAKLSDSAAAELQFSPGRAASSGGSSRRRRRSVPAPGYEPSTRREAIRERARAADPQANEIPF